MSDDQIKEILRRLDKQDQDNLTYRNEREKLDEERLNAHYRVYQSVREESTQIKREIANLKEDLKPVMEAYTDGSGFLKILTFILRLLGLLSIAGGAIYATIRWLKQ